MSESHEIEYLLTLNVEPTYAEIRKLEISLVRIAHILRRITGSEEIDKAIATVQRAIMLLRIMQATALAVATATGPIGWLYALTMVAGTVATTTDFLVDMSGH